MPTIRPSREDYQSYLREALGRKVELRDTGKRGEVDPGDVMTYRKDGKLHRVKLGTTRFEQARIQLGVVSAARQFADAGVSFAGTDADYAVNKSLWWMGYGGRMGVRAGVKPSDAINDIFKNGDQYGMECATATMVILHKAILDRIGPEDFDQAFARLKLFRWTDKDTDFQETERVGKLPGFVPGDHTYFKNPDFAPEHSAWQGENVIYLGNGEYFGHGVGIADEKQIVEMLNSLRKPNARVGARRDDFELRLDPKNLAKLDVTP
jgi:protein-glutamine gamma-glutamyltransferase